MVEKKKPAADPASAGPALTFEAHLESLEGIVAQLEKGDLPLEESIERYRKGLASLRACYEILQRAQKQVEELTRDVRGALSTKPFEGGGGAEAEEKTPF